MRNDVSRVHRRSFLRLLAASPLCTALAAGVGAQAETDRGDIVKSPEEALDVFDLQATARSKLPPAHYGYLATGTNNDGTLRENRRAFGDYYLRSRRLVDVNTVDSRVSIFGQEWPTPIVIAPAGSQRAFHGDGEIATARAARNLNHLQILSTVSSTPIEQVVEARGEPVWFQLYTAGGWSGTRQMLRRAEAVGCPAAVLTVDNPFASARLTLERAIRRDNRNCKKCHSGNGVAAGPKPMFDGIDLGGPHRRNPTLTWEFLEKLRDETTMKLLVKGIVTAEDAERCISLGVDGIIVSNHGGRAEDSGRGAIDSLAEVASVAKGVTTLLMDSGIRRGTDIIKALALGADAICVGRPYLWGLGAFGQAGVERALQLLRDELRLAMQLTGAPTLGHIGPDAIGIA